MINNIKRILAGVVSVSLILNCNIPMTIYGNDLTNSNTIDVTTQNEVLGNPLENNDSVILSNEDVMTDDITKWTITKEGGKITLENDEKGQYIRLHSATTDAETRFSPKISEAASGIYLQDSVITFEYEMNVPSNGSISNSALLKLIFDATDESKKEDSKSGTWFPSLVVDYNENMIRTYKSPAKGDKSLLYNADDTDVLGRWVKISGAINMKTGIVTVSKEDGSTVTVDMHVPPGWGGDDIYYAWAKYMYTKQITFNIKAKKAEGCDVLLRNVSLKRLSNTLGVSDCSFNDNDYYVDTQNIKLTFNDKVSEDGLRSALYIADENGNKVENAVKSIVISDGVNAHITLNKLKNYTKYSLNVNGLRAINYRSMKEDFVRRFTTKKGSDVFVDIKDTEAQLNTYGKPLLETDKLSYKVVVKNDSQSEKDICIALGVFGEQNELLKIKYENIKVASPKTVKEIILDQIPLGAKCIKIFAFNKNNNEISTLLHEPDLLQEYETLKYEVDTSKTLPEFYTGIIDSQNSIVGVGGKTTETTGINTIILLDGKNTPLSSASEKTAALGYAMVNSDGTYNCTFKFNGKSGQYSTYVITDNGAYSQSFDYMKDVDLVNNYIKKIADGSIEKDDIFEKTVEFNAGLGIDFVNNFLSERDKKLLEKRVRERRNTLLGPENADYIRQYSDIIDNLMNEIKFLNELYKISYYGMIEEKLRDGIAFTGIDFVNYDKLKSSQKAYVTESMLGKAFDDGDEVKTFFDEYVIKAGKINETGGSGSGGGGGDSHGSSGGSGSGTVSYTREDNEYDEKEKVTVFSDMGSHKWALEAVESLARKGIINGTEENIFDPEANVTREEFVKMIVSAAKIPTRNLTSDFLDIEENAWYSPYVAAAKNSKIINGIDDRKFGVGLYISREDMAVMIHNTFSLKSYKFTKTYNSFLDMDKISDYANKAVAELAGEGVIKGLTDNTFNPKGCATRAEAAVLIYALEGRIN
ncbi:MAG: S-layer homology domain-containing protein [Oscillospiraceae bacterium]